VNFAESQNGLLLFGGNFFFYSGTAVSNLYHLANEDQSPALLPQEFKYYGLMKAHYISLFPESPLSSFILPLPQDIPFILV